MKTAPVQLRKRLLLKLRLWQKLNNLTFQKTLLIISRVFFLKEGMLWR